MVKDYKGTVLTVDFSGVLVMTRVLNFGKIGGWMVKP